MTSPAKDDLHSLRSDHTDLENKLNDKTAMFSASKRLLRTTGECIKKVDAANFIPLQFIYATKSSGFSEWSENLREHLTWSTSASEYPLIEHKPLERTVHTAHILVTSPPFNSFEVDNMITPTREEVNNAVLRGLMVEDEMVTDFDIRDMDTPSEEWTGRTLSLDIECTGVSSANDSVSDDDDSEQDDFASTDKPVSMDDLEELAATTIRMDSEFADHYSPHETPRLYRFPLPHRPEPKNRVICESRVINGKTIYLLGNKVREPTIAENLEAYNRRQVSSLHSLLMNMRSETDLYDEYSGARQRIAKRDEEYAIRKRDWLLLDDWFLRPHDSDIECVSKQTDVSHHDAAIALKDNKYDIVDAIMELTI